MHRAGTDTEHGRFPGRLSGALILNTAHARRICHRAFSRGVAGGGFQRSSLWREDDGRTAWLDGHADRSVVFVSLGSLAVISRKQFTEFLSGLVAAGYPFLWMLRPDMAEAAGQDAALREAIRAVGCFLTHAGWNSTLEGVPMVCWPFFADQQINSRMVGAVWRNGLDMKDVCDRAVVQRTLKEAMESELIKGTAQALAQQVRRDVVGRGT